MIEEIGLLPPFYRFGVAGIALYLNYSSLVVRREWFTKLAFEDKLEILQHWMDSNLSFKTKFTKLLLILILIAVFDDPLVLNKLGVNYNSYSSTLGFYYGKR